MKWHESQIYMFIMLIVISRSAFVIVKNGEHMEWLKGKPASIQWLQLFCACNFKWWQCLLQNFDNKFNLVYVVLQQSTQ